MRSADNALDRVEEVLTAPTLPEPAVAAALPRDVTTLVGASGSGKTTLARLVGPTVPRAGLADRPGTRRVVATAVTWLA